jgi:hypothetical protein
LVSMYRFSLAQLGNPYSRAIVSCTSLRLSWASRSQRPWPGGNAGEIPDPLGYSRSTGAPLFLQVLRLIFEMIEVRIRLEASSRHVELPFVCPTSAIYGQKVSS